MSNIDKYTSFIAEQVRKSGGLFADGKRGTIVKSHVNPDEGEWETHSHDKGDELKL